MRSAVIFVLLLAAVVVGLLVGGVFESKSEDPGGTERANTSNPEDPGLNTGDGNQNATEPASKPPLEFLPFRDDTRVLYLGATPSTPDTFLMTKVFAATDAVSYHGWYLNPGKSEPLGMNKGLPPLTSMPTGLTLEKHDHTLVVVSNILPSDVPDDFWDTLAKRVKAGSTNVLWRAWPPYPSESTDAPAMIHPYLEHPVVRHLLPIKAVAELRGVPTASGQARIPGNFGEKGTPFVPMAGATAHPATRLVSWEKWSSVWWAELGEGDYRLRMKFCVPVTELADGATALLGAKVKGADPIPVLVVGKHGDGRVAWFGTREIAWKPMYNPTEEIKMVAVMNGIVAWLSGGS